MEMDETPLHRRFSNPKLKLNASTFIFHIASLIASLSSVTIYHIRYLRMKEHKVFEYK